MGDVVETDERLSEKFIEFAKLHVKAALEAAYLQSNLRVQVEGEDDSIQEIYEDGTITAFVDRESILNAYPEENIK